MSARRVLLTNWALVNRGGSELYVRDLAVGLLRRGYEPVVWSPLLGEVAQEIRAAGVEVSADLGALAKEPHLLHGQHHDETLAALSRFPDRPGLFVQHGAVPWQEEAPNHPRLLRYVAVDELCRERLLESGIAGDRIAVIGNSVDLDRFLPRSGLPRKPRRALALSNSADEGGYLTHVRAACARMGIHLDVAGVGVGAPMADPARSMAHYDVVFGKARVALEALAVGCAVVVVDEPGIGGLVTSEALPEWLRWNLGRRLMTRAHDADLLCDELERYDPDDVVRCCDHIRSHRGLESMIDAITDEYDRVLAAWEAAPAPDHAAELAAVSARLRMIGPLRSSEEVMAAELRDAATRIEVMTAERDACRAELAAVHADREALRTERDALRNRKAVRWVESVAGLRNGRAR